MARSLHTQKLVLRAERRLARPYSKRRSEALILSGRAKDSAVTAPLCLPIRMCRPQPGLYHPITRQDIEATVRLLGPASIYGLKSIQLRSEPAIREEGIVFAEYSVSADILLYALPTDEWHVPFLLAASDLEAFQRFGAHIEADIDRTITTVRWSRHQLKRYCSIEVLAHELGHHAVQRRRGIFGKPACRTKDHERLADLYCVRALQVAKENAICE